VRIILKLHKLSNKEDASEQTLGSKFLEIEI
jgi:hypothetical protein